MSTDRRGLSGQAGDGRKRTGPSISTVSTGLVGAAGIGAVAFTASEQAEQLAALGRSLSADLQGVVDTAKADLTDLVATESARLKAELGDARTDALDALDAKLRDGLASLAHEVDAGKERVAAKARAEGERVRRLVAEELQEEKARVESLLAKLEGERGRLEGLLTRAQEERDALEAAAPGEPTPARAEARLHIPRPPWARTPPVSRRGSGLASAEDDGEPDQPEDEDDDSGEDLSV